MKESNAILLTSALASVRIAEAEEPATQARIVRVLRVLFEADESESEIDAALVQLQSWGLVQRNENIYCLSDVGESLLLKCQEGTLSQREHLEAVEQLLSARLTAGSNNSLKSDAAKPRTLD